MLYLAIFSLVYSGAGKYFEYKISQAIEFVTSVNGVPYLGERTRYHTFWHPLWCGLGDFDEKYGYVWQDARARDVARSEMIKRGWKEPKMDPSKGRYYEITTSPLYRVVIRDKIISNIKEDPAWYLGILGKRVKKILTQWQDVQLNLVFFLALPALFSHAHFATDMGGG